MYQDSRDSYTKTLRSYLSVLAYPITYVSNLPKNTLEGLSVSLSDRSSIIDENRKLKEENIQLKSDLQQVYKLDAENKRLYALRNHIRIEKKFLICRYNHNEYTSDRHQITINKGSVDGVNVGDAVADPNGVIGHVIRDQLFSSEILLISDLEHAIPIEIINTGERAIAYGTGDMSRLEIRSIPNSKAKIEMSCHIWIRWKYPEGFPIGEISE